MERVKSLGRKLDGGSGIAEAAVTGAIAAMVMMSSFGAASAATLPNPTVHFDNLTSGFNGPGAYTESGFDFDPTSFQAGNCSPFPDASDPCIKEVQQSGVVTTMTRNGGGTFTLTGFYFDLQGTGGQDPINQLIVSSEKSGLTPLIFQIGQLAPTGTQLYNNYSYAPPSGPLTGDIYNGPIGNNVSYFVTIDLPAFQDVASVTWSTFQAQNLRIDDISATVAAVPVPASALLLLGGIGGFAALRRRKTA